MHVIYRWISPSVITDRFTDEFPIGNSVGLSSFPAHYTPLNAFYIFLLSSLNLNLIYK